MKSLPPGRRTLATTSAQRRMSGSQQIAPMPGVDEVEALAAERVGRAVEIRLDELHLDADGRGQAPALLERGRGEVEPGHAGAEPRQRDGVGADVALQVHGVETRDVAEARTVEADDLAEERRDPR